MSEKFPLDKIGKYTNKKEIYDNLDIWERRALYWQCKYDGRVCWLEDVERYYQHVFNEDGYEIKKEQNYDC